jgi:hypothetical protein
VHHSIQPVRIQAPESRSIRGKAFSFI